MSFDRNLIQQDQVGKFLMWLDSQQINHRDGKGEYQLAQVQTPDGWLVINIDSKGNISTHNKMKSLIDEFNSSMIQPTVEQPHTNINDDIKFTAKHGTSFVIPGALSLSATNVTVFMSNEATLKQTMIDFAEFGSFITQRMTGDNPQLNKMIPDIIASLVYNC